MTSVHAPLVSAAHASCLGLHPYTVNSTADMRSLLSLGVDGMFTNFPDRLNTILGSDAAPAKQGVRLASEAHDACRATR